MIIITTSLKAKRPQGLRIKIKRRMSMVKYVCEICGYVYDPAVGDPENGIAANTPWEEVKEDWVCPVCGVGKDQFAPQN